MEKAAIRPAQAPASGNPIARNAAARQAAGSEAQGGFSLLLADMAAPAALAVAAEDPLAGADPSLAALPGQDLAAIDAMAGSGLFSLASLVGQTARMDGAADTAQRDGRDLPETEGLRRSAALPMGAGQPAAAPQAPAWAAAGARDTAGNDTGAALLQASTELSDTPAAGSATLSPALSERGTQPHGLAALIARMEPEPQAMASALAPAGPPGLSAPGNAAAPATGGGAGDAAGIASAAETAPTDTLAEAAAADPVLSMPDDTWADQLSEQVAFWVQQKTQRAEMTIDRQGQPVQVQVAITGSEAHVTFRSNEQQTRDMLDASTAQLREMLEQQGLTLAGVTVQTGNAGGQGGSARQDASGRQAARGDEGQRQTAEVAVDLRGRTNSGRTVDLFV
ncbi:flagellar hook-length control protein FliK [Comamonas endophytica]|uniref:Flagellar hook-length control protein FliK n=1 Tax=Comamonas endophytica TaxID=2949090 RepID=A0ABY6GCZ3_9BURK|nr:MULTISPECIES: flagellar hook-length control protein FliK [unclassified Acidovorax]MCD2512750.1 flagellar hook-length control protein FliK [Acidovorax sp. D4N7]UYG52899.1 flagellar hook-length control protein FliK [Acidovorax sp. 5MLIR]